MDEDPDDAPKSLRGLFNQLAKMLMTEVASGRLSLAEGTELAKRLRDCQVSINGLRPGGVELLQGIQRDLALSIACRALIEKIWEITTLK